MNNQSILDEGKVVKKINKSLFIVILSYIYLIIFGGIILPLALFHLTILLNKFGLISLLLILPSIIIIFTNNKFLYRLISFILVAETLISILIIIVLSGAEW